MPELPDVEELRKYLESTALHKAIGRTVVRDNRILENATPQSLGRHLKGRELQEGRRHGKYLFGGLGSDEWLVMHFGMTGGLVHYESGDPPEYARVLLDFEEDGTLAYTSKRILGKVGFTDELDRYLEDRDLGPDALDGHLTREDFAGSLSGRRASIKSALMNQSIVAGIGNIYSDEILFQSRIHPGREARELSRDELDGIFDNMREILGESSGSGARKGEEYLHGHRNPGAECPRCGTPLDVINVSGRTSYFCPVCQKNGS